MNRREFIKLSTLAGLAASLPLNILIDNKDAETRMFEYILNNVHDELLVIGITKHYIYNELNKPLSNNSIGSVLNGVAKRQPNLIKWLRSRIDLKDTTSRYALSKRKLDLELSWKSYYMAHYVLLPKFNFKPYEKLLSKEEFAHMGYTITN